jgi:hypothetical protein
MAIDTDKLEEMMMNEARMVLYLGWDSDRPSGSVPAFPVPYSSVSIGY